MRSLFKTYLLPLSLLFLLFSAPLHGDIPAAQRNALLALYDSTNGAGWNNNANWYGAAGTENTWYGVTTDGGNTTVLQLRLGSNNLSGPLPAAVGNLPDLTVLYLDRNSISGTIPTQLGNLGSLTNLNLLNNSLSGSIPVELGSLTSLTALTLAGNGLTGTVPDQLNNLTSLLYLYLNNNQLQSSLPDLGALTLLRRLYLDSNNFTSAVPTWIGSLSALQILRLGNNRFSGSIPSQLGNLGNLTNLLIHSNRLTGSLPAGLSNLSSLVANGSDFRWNGVHTSDGSLRTFLNARQRNGNDWESTQTVPPTDVTVDSSDYTSIRLSWTPITYTDGPGGYIILYSTSPGGPYVPFPSPSANKSSTGHEVPGLAEGTQYYLVVQTFTDPHGNNVGTTVVSDYSAEVTATTTGDSISGYVRTGGGQGVENVTMTFTNGVDAVTTNGSGYYSQSVPHGWSGRVTPSLAGYTFAPEYNDYSNVNSDLTDENYTATPITPAISGTVTLGGSGLSNVVLTFSNGGGSVTTGADGSYSLQVPYGYNGTATPVLAGYTFSPVERSYGNVTSAQAAQDYTATAVTPLISGRVTLGGNGLANVTLTFSNGGGSVTTGSDGSYSQAVTYGWTGSVTPYRSGYTFSPSQRSYNTAVTAGQANQNFTAAAITPVISGRITDGGSTGLSGATLTFSNGGGTAVTDANGYYTNTLTYGWSGTVTPSRNGYTFSPGNRNYSGLTSGANNQDYTATAILPIISGRVTLGNSGLSGVSLVFSNGGGTAVTDSSGNYTHAVAYNWSGTVTPSRAGYTFSPGSRDYSGVTASQGNQDYSGSTVFFSISGTVTAADGAGLGGIPINTVGGAQRAVTNANGAYAFNVAYGWSGTVYPAAAGYRYTPSQRVYNNVTSNSTGQDYTAAVITLTLSGRVAGPAGSGIANVVINLSNDGGSTVTNFDGTYSIQVTYGWSGVSTPSRAGYVFTPTQLAYNSVTASRADQDFVAEAVMPVISGHVTDASGVGLSGVTLAFSGTGTTATGANGNYSTAVPYGWSGTVTASRAGFSFDPAQRDYSNVTAGQNNQDYTAEAVSPVISGRISEPTGEGIYDVTLTFSNGGGSTTTDANGNYLQAVPYGWSGAVAPAKTGFTFAPASRDYSSVTETQTGQDYSATAVSPVISGRITDGSGSGVPGVVLTFSNNGGVTASDSQGNYLQAVANGWSGSVSLEKTGHTFTPQTRDYFNVERNYPGENYTGTSITPSISGRIFDPYGNPMEGVTITASSGGFETMTNNRGRYLLEVHYGWSGTLVPSLRGYTFTPGDISFTNVTGGITGQDFKAAAFIILNLEVTRHTERAWVARRDYGNVKVTVENLGDLEVESYVLYRKSADGTYEQLTTFAPTGGSQADQFLYTDTYLDKSITYTYKVTALAPGGETLADSEEVSI